MTLGEFEAYVEEVRAQNSIVDVVGDDAKLHGDGAHRLKCLSPFRKERTASFFVYSDQDSFYDFGAHIGGDAFSYCQERDNCNFREAVDTLAKRAGLKTWDERKNGEALNPEHEAEIAATLERRWVEDLQTEAATYYHRCLPPKIRAFVRDHYGFTDETIDIERIGWADGSLFTYLHEDQGVKVDKILKTGMFIRTDAGRIFELHEDRITFPYLRRGKAPYLISRRLDEWTPDTDFQKAKYKKTLVHSERHSYVSTTVRNDVFSGEDSVRRPVKYCIITEGKTDRISATQAGWASISPVTTQFRDRDHEKLIKLTANVDVVVMVNDEEKGKLNPRTRKIHRPGLDGALKTAAALFKAGRDVRIVRLPRPDGVDKVDVNSFLRDHGEDAFRKLVETAKSYPQYLIEQVPENVDAAEINIHLCPIYELIASCKGAARDAYVNAIAERLRITKKTIREEIADFLKNGSGSSTPSQTSSTEPTTPPPASSGSSNRSGDVFIGVMKGGVYESPDRYYMTKKKTKEDEDDKYERISNFVLRPTKEILVAKNDDLICCDVTMVDGREFLDQILPFNALDGTREFIRCLHRISKRLAWAGGDPNVAGIIDTFREKKNLPAYRGVPAFGYVETREGPRYVLPDSVLGKDGPIQDSKLIYAPVTRPPLADRLDFVGAELPEAGVADLATHVLPRLFELNEPDFILPILGWFYASTFAPAIRRLRGHFSLLWIWGTQGSSKSTTIRDIFWRLHGVRGEPSSCSDTPFAMIVNMSASTSVPGVMDEYTSRIGGRVHERLVELLKKNYSGADEGRGRPDLKVNVYSPLSPLCIIGEQMPSRASLRERSVCASPRKNSLSLERRRIFNELTALRLTHLAGAWVRFALSINVDDAWATAEAGVKSMVDISRISPRICDSLTIVVFGNQMFDAWAKSMGVDIQARPQVRDHIKRILAAITESEDGSGVVKDAFDRFLEAVSVYAHRGLLEDGREFAMVDEQLCLHVPTLYEIYLQERRKAGLPDETNGKAALMRCVQEKQADPEGYVVSAKKRVMMPRSGRRVTTVVIEPAKIPEHIDYVEFYTDNRGWGGVRRDAYTDKPN